MPADVAEVVVLNGDIPLVEAGLVTGVLERRRRAGAAVALVSFEAWEPGALGRVILAPDGDRVARLVEARDATPDELAVSEVNAGLYAFDAAWLRLAVERLTPSPATGEYYITQLVDLAVSDGLAVVTHEVPDDGALDGINDRAQLAEATAMLRERINLAWLRAGVTMHDPATAYIDADVDLAPDVTLEPNVILRGRTRVEEGSVIGAGSQLVDSLVGPRCRVWASVLEQASVEEGTTIGPFSHLRPGSSIGPNVQLGNFAEVKSSRLERGVKQHHMSYLGDAHVGAGTNVGAGTITANYDGVRKHHTEIGERVFLGVDTMLRAPVTIGDGAKTGAGAVVTRDVPAGMLAVGVPARIRELRSAVHRSGGGPCGGSGQCAGGGQRAGARRRRAGRSRGRPGSIRRPAAVDRGSLMDLARPARRHRHPYPAGRVLRRERDRARLDPAQPGRPARRRGEQRSAAGPGPAGRPRPLPGRRAARPDDPRVLRLRLRRGQPRRRVCRAFSPASTPFARVPPPSRS